MLKVFMKIKNEIFECVPEETTMNMTAEAEGYYTHVDGVNACRKIMSKRVELYIAIIPPANGWSCKKQRLWHKLTKKKRTILLVQDNGDSATEYTFKDVEITHLSNIATGEMDGRCVPLIPILSGTTLIEPDIKEYRKGWWE